MPWNRPSSNTVPPTPDKEAVPRTMMGRLLAIARAAEKAVLCLLLTVMILLACTQILLRGAFSGGLLWADPFLRYLVLWSGLLGACLAVSRASHISLDLAGHLIPEKYAPLIGFLCNIFSTVVATMLTWAAILFLRDELAYSTEGLFGLPSWLWNFIFPLAFSLMSARYLLQTIICGREIVTLLAHKGSGHPC